MKCNRRVLLVVLSLMTACENSPSDLVSRADREALNQRSQLAQHLYLRALQRHTEADDLRLRALSGLARVSFNQLHDYPLGMRTVDQLLREFKDRSPKDANIRQIRMQASEVARLQLQEPSKSLELIQPYVDADYLSAHESQELGRSLIFLGQYESALKILRRAWDVAAQMKNCSELKRLQLDLIEIYVIQRKCDEAIRWADIQIPVGCEKDRVAVESERAHCFELQGSTDGAVKILEDLLKENPDNPRIHFLISSLKKRIREKQMR